MKQAGEALWPNQLQASLPPFALTLQPVAHRSPARLLDVQKQQRCRSRRGSDRRVCARPRRHLSLLNELFGTVAARRERDTDAASVRGLCDPRFFRTGWTGFNPHPEADAVPSCITPSSSTCAHTAASPQVLCRQLRGENQRTKNLCFLSQTSTNTRRRTAHTFRHTEDELYRRQVPSGGRRSDVCGMLCVNLL